MILKQTPEDFIVTEISSIQPQDKGSVAYFTLKKKDYTTPKSIEIISKALKIPTKTIGFAGNKDRRAITKQLISLPQNKKAHAERLKLSDISLTFKGYGSEQINLGDLKENQFKITIRDIDPDKINSIEIFPNYYDTQRFSSQNHVIGKLLIKKKYKKACTLLKETSIADHLEKHPNDNIGAIRTLSIKNLRFYIHAYQSLLWNRMANTIIKIHPHKSLEIESGELSFPTTNIPNQIIPLIGFGTDLNTQTQDILNSEGISQRDFIIREIPSISSEGSKRELLMDIQNLNILKKTKDTITISFTLKKGSYATMAIKALLI